MKLTDLAKFVDTVEAGAVTRAAHRIGVSQPSLSRTLREIETQMGAQLLRRNGRGVELTPAGEEFLTFARTTLAALDETRRRVRNTAATPPARLVLAVPPGLGRVVIPDLHRAFAARLPDTALHVFEETTERSAELLAQGGIDIALAYATADRAAADAIPLFRETLYAVGTPETLGTADDPIGLRDLGRLPILAPSQGSFRALINRGFAAQGITPRIARELETTEALIAFATARDGIAILPFSNVCDAHRRGEVIVRPIVDPKIERRAQLVAGKALGAPTLRAALDALRTALSAVGGDTRWQVLSPPP